MSDNESKPTKDYKSDSTDTTDTTDTTGQPINTKKPLSLTNRIIIPIIVVFYLILVYNFFNNYETNKNFGIAETLTQKIDSLTDNSQFKGSDWHFFKQEIFLKLLSPSIYAAEQFELIKNSLSNTKNKNVSTFLRKTGLYLIKPFLLLLQVLFHTITYPFSSIVDKKFVEAEPRFINKGWIAVFIFFFQALYHSIYLLYFVGFFIVFYIIFPILNIITVWPAIKEAKYVILFLIYYIITTIITNQIKKDHPDIWDSDIEKRFKTANSILTLTMILIFFIF
jgi:hypothetical protein